MRTSIVFVALSLLAIACGDDTTVTMDASTPDATTDVGTRCESANDCSDGFFCTGEEMCVDSVCVPGDAVNCDDGIECTLDACNEISNSCESLAPDVDGDGSGDMGCVDALGEPLGRDCDDSDARRFGGNREVCDLDEALEGGGLDEDCDATTFGAIDSDGDGFFDARCFNMDDAGTRNGGNDCSDGRSDVNPGATETCDHTDNNCDGNVDEGVLITVAPDADRDGFPVEGMTSMECPGFAGLVAIDEDTLFDCNDGNPAINPGQLEICDEVDNNCNMEIDDDTQIVAWYSDNDGDGFGSAASGVVMSCEPVVGASVLGTDCDDDNPAVHPAAAETCDGTDQDCNGRADFEISMGNFEDDDGDGSADIACGEPLGVDCNDLDPNTARGTAESCDGRDNDCDDVIDEEVSDFVWYYDGDRDGYGSDSTVRFPPIVSCSAPLNYVGSSADCDDGDAGRSPAATEDCNRLDDDCDGAIDEGASTCECPVGTMDCDGDALGVCETRTDSDPENCGGCGISCGGNDCIAGVCEANRCSVTSVFNGFVTYARVECTDGSYAPICADETTDTDEDGFSDCNDNLCINGFITAGLPERSVNCETEGGVVSCCGPAYIAAVCPDATDWRDCNCFNCANSR